MSRGMVPGMGGAGGTAEGPVVIERAAGAGGELALRRAGDHWEIISNGVFLMDTRNGESERLLVRAAAAAVHGTRHRPGPQPEQPQQDGQGGQDGQGARMLIGGLGVGFSLAEALTLDGVAHITVVEREPAVIGWHAGPLRPWSRGALDDPRVTVRCADLLEVIGAAPAGTFDAVCLDIDNGPDWTVTPGNARLYGPAGLGRLARLLTPRGVLAVWSANAAPAFEELLRGRFTRVEVQKVPVPRGEPDVIYLAGRPHPAP